MSKQQNMVQFHNMRLIPKPMLARFFGVTNEGLKAMRENDPTFPKPIKIGTTRQAPVYFDGVEIESWIDRKKQERDAAVSD